LLSTADTIAIIRALLSLSAAIREMQGAIAALAESKSENALAFLQASAKANDQGLEYIQKFVEFIEKGHG
jgi:hypothetical protein